MLADPLFAQTQNPTVRENAQAGTDLWRLKTAAKQREIEGFASATSINRGEGIQLFVSCVEPKYSIDLYRMGWYNGRGARRVGQRAELKGSKQAEPKPDPTTGLIECAWTASYTIPGAVTAEWTSGIYLAKLTANRSGSQRYIVFVVRDDARRSDLLFQSAVTTFQAYNPWGGKSLYLGDPQARKVSFDRPYAEGNGAGQFLRWEYNMVRFLEREGYDVTYCTNIDTHARPDLMTNHRAFVIVGHDEYWSWEMRSHLESDIKNGKHVAFFSGNNIYWQIRFEPNGSGSPMRTITSYKEAALEQDPLYLDKDRSNNRLVTTKWRNPPVSKPEDSLVGVMYESGNYGIDADIVVEAASHWVFQRSGLKAGDHLPGLLGYEVDRMFGNAPKNTVRLAHSPFKKGEQTRHSDMTIYTAPSGALVFATGSIQWSWGVDSFAPENGSRQNEAALQVTRNVLNRMIAPPA